MTYVTKNYRARTPKQSTKLIDVFIGSRIRHFRKLRRISQVELAAASIGEQLSTNTKNMRTEATGFGQPFMDDQPVAGSAGRPFSSKG